MYFKIEQSDGLKSGPALIQRVILILIPDELLELPKVLRSPHV